jgi:hypothetical protein
MEGACTLVALLWNHKISGWYERAVEHCNYPMDVIGDDLVDMISPSDVVVDAGAGIGPVSLAAAPLCQRVIAVDKLPGAIAILRQRVATAGVNNVETVVGDWLTVHLVPCDVVVCAYAIGVSRNPACLRKIWSVSNKGLILTSIGSFRESYAFNHVAAGLGLQLEQDCLSGCLERGLLEGLGATVTCRPVIHDFGQPVDSAEEAWEYVKHQLKVGDDLDSTGLDLVQEVLEVNRGCLYLPIRRRSCVIKFTKTKRRTFR